MNGKAKIIENPKTATQNGVFAFIEDTPPFYNLSVFNRCADTKTILLTLECWQDVHPGLVSIPVNLNYDIPYGLLYSLKAPDDVLAFVEKVK